MKKELIAWIVIIVGSTLGFFLFREVLPPDSSALSTAFTSPSFAAPAFFATTALSAFFLIFRILNHYNGPFYPTRFRHIIGATILSAGVVVSWEFSQMFLIGRPFSFYILLGCLGGCFLIILVWGFLKLQTKKNPNQAR